MGDQLDQLNTSAGEEGVLVDEDGVGPFSKCCKRRIDISAGAGAKDLDLHSHGTGSRFRVSQCGLRRRWIGRIDEHSDESKPGYQFTQEFQLFGRQLGIEKVDTCQVGVWTGEAP